jgi:hypothetical protein
MSRAALEQTLGTKLPIIDTSGVKNVSISSGVLNIDFNYGVHIVSHNQNITSLTYSNIKTDYSSKNEVIIILTQDSVGGRTITGSYLTAGGLGLDISTTANAINIISILTLDGITFYSFSSGKNFS